MMAVAADEALQDIFARAFGCPLARLDAAPAAMPPDALSIRMLLACDGVAGAAVLSVPAGLVALVASRMVSGASAVALDEAGLRDFGGELCNMLVGRVAARLAADGAEVTLGTPHAAVATVATAAHWVCAGFPLDFQVCRGSAS